MRSNNLQRIVESVTLDIIDESGKSPGDTKKHKRRKFLFALWKSHPWK